MKERRFGGPSIIRRKMEKKLIIELLSTSDDKCFNWKDRSNITDYLLELHEKYGVTEYVSDGYVPTKKVKTVYTEYRFA